MTSSFCFAPPSDAALLAAALAAFSLAALASLGFFLGGMGGGRERREEGKE